MSALLIAWLISLPPVFLVGWAFGRASCRLQPDRSEHQHIWAPWEKGTIRLVSPTGEFLYNRATQERACLDCGYLELERVQVQR